MRIVLQTNNYAFKVYDDENKLITYAECKGASFDCDIKALMKAINALDVGPSGYNFKFDVSGLPPDNAEG